MLVIISIMLVGFLTGRLLKHRVSGILPNVITLLIWILLFLLGVEAGSNEDVVKNIANLGAEAFVVTAGALGGSIALSWLLWKNIAKSGKKEEKP